jgi:hypothetical protein
MWDNCPEMQGETPLSRDDFAMRFLYNTGYKPSMQGALPGAQKKERAEPLPVPQHSSGGFRESRPPLERCSKEFS